PFVLTMRSSSACSSMSSHTQPQKVQVACFTMVRLMASLVLAVLLRARTGRQDESSAQFPAAVAAPDATRHVAAGFDLFPGSWFIGLRRRNIRRGAGFARITKGIDRPHSHLLETIGHRLAAVLGAVRGPRTAPRTAVNQFLTVPAPLQLPIPSTWACP